MARPQKSGLDYYPLETDFLNDLKIRRIMKACGANSIAVIIYLLSNIYKDEGYFIEWNNDVAFLAADNVGVEEDLVIEVVKMALSVDFFNETLFEEYKILTSKGIQERYLTAVTRRKSVEIVKEFSLLSGINDYNNLVYVNINSENVNINSENVNKSTQRKEKERKEKKIIKEKYKKESKKLPFEINNEIIEKIKNIWLLHYANTRNTKYQFNTKDLTAITDLFYIFVDIYPNNDLEQTIKVFEYYFENALKISDKWYFNNMTLHLLQTKFNEINTYISNENNRANNERNELYRKMQSINDYLTEQGY